MLTRRGCVRGRADGGRARPVAQQGDLAEPVAASERVDDASVADHLRATGLDHVEPVAALALLEDRLPRRELGMLEPGAELFDRRRREHAEHRDRAQDLDVRVADAHAAVEPAQRRPARGHGQPAPGGRRRRARGARPSTSMTTGASRPPNATPSVRIASKPANMRARTVSSVSRASIVKPPTSISALPTPDEAEQDDRRRLLGDDADQRQRRAEQRDPDAEPAWRARRAGPARTRRASRARRRRRRRRSGRRRPGRRCRAGRSRRRRRTRSGIRA